MDIGSEPTIINIPSVDAYVLGVCDLISRAFAKIVALDPKVMESFFLFKLGELIIYSAHFLIVGLTILIYSR